MHQKQKRGGFTLIELIIVITIIAIFAAFVFVALDPETRFIDSRNSKRWTAVNSILDAIKLYQIDNDGALPSGIDTTLKMLGTNSSGCNISCGSGGDSHDLSIMISQARDAGEEQNPPNGSINWWSSDIELVTDGSINQEVGLRFLNVAIPSGVLITNAYVEFVADEIDTGTTSVNIYAEDIDDSPRFENVSGSISGRDKTTASISWNNIPAWNTIGEVHQSPNISTVIQEIIDRPGWSSGNALTLIINGSGERTAESYNDSSSQAPLLYIEYTTSEVTNSSCLDLSTDLATYLPNIPQDPKDGSDNKTYYAVKQLSSGTIQVISCSAESGEDITKTK